MAGSEKTGYEYSTDHLIENAYYILTPSEDVGLDQSEPTRISQLVLVPFL